jgi:hypothetical protein
MRPDSAVRTTRGRDSVAYGASIDCRSTGSDQPLWTYGGAVGLQVWAVTLTRAVWATLLIEDAPRGGPIMLLNAVLAGTPDEGAAISWALGLLVECLPGFYVLRAS